MSSKSLAALCLVTGLFSTLTICSLDALNQSDSTSVRRAHSSFDPSTIAHSQMTLDAATIPQSSALASQTAATQVASQVAVNSIIANAPAPIPSDCGGSPCGLPS